MMIYSEPILATRHPGESERGKFFQCGEHRCGYPTEIGNLDGIILGSWMNFQVRLVSWINLWGD
jgi:hypothetical protein